MANPAISVAMSVYNGERFLDAALESVLAQTFGDFELLVVDDGSRDGTAAILKTWAERDTRVRPIIRENRGLVASLNELLDRARAPLVARMDADDWCHPERFARQLAFLNANPAYGVVGTWTEDMDEDGAELTRQYPDHPLTHEAMLRAIPRKGPLICHPSAMYRRDVVLSVGGYHAAFRHCEDLDLWLRLASVTRLGNIAERLLRYRRYEDQVSSRHSTEQQINAAISRLAWQEREAGRPDPTAALSRLPQIDALDAMFARPGLARQVRADVAPALVHSSHAMRGAGFDLLLDHLREGGSPPGMWRTVARLMRFGEPARALRLAATLASRRIAGA